MSTLRINNIEAKSVPASPTLDEKVKITNSSGDVLIHLDGKTAGITTIGINTTASNITFDANSNAQLTGIVTATNFKTGSSNLHSTGLTVGNNFLHSTGINVGTGATIHVPSSNVLTLGTNSNENFRIDSNGKIINTAATDSVATLDLFGGNTNVSGSGEVNAQIRFRSKDASVTGDGTGGAIKSITEIGNGAYVGMAFETFMQGRSPAIKEAFRISYNGQIGLGGQNYGSAGQVLTSQGSGSPVQWATPSLPTLPHAFVFMDSQYFTSSVTLLEFNNSTANDRSSGVTITRGGSERFTPTVAGTYFVQAHLTYSHGGGVYTPVLYIYRNGSGYSSLSSSGIVNYGGGHNDSLSCQAMMTFNGTSDYVDMRASHNGGGNATMKSYSTFAMFRVGA